MKIKNKRGNPSLYNLTIFQKPLGDVDDRYDKPPQIPSWHCLQMFYCLGMNPSCIFTLKPSHFQHCSEEQCQLEYHISVQNVTHWLKIHYLVRGNLMHGYTGGRVGGGGEGIPWVGELIGYFGGDNCWPTMMMPKWGWASKLPSSCLVPSRYLTLAFNSVSQLIPRTPGKVYHIFPSTHLLARQEVQMKVDQSFLTPGLVLDVTLTLPMEKYEEAHLIILAVWVTGYRKRGETNHLFFCFF